VSRRHSYVKAYEERQLSYQPQGSLFWMAPEVVRQQDYNAKVDIWALGCVLIEMITARFPWYPENEFSVIYNLGRGRCPPWPEDVDPEADAFMKRCFQIDASQRPTADELLSDPFCEEDPDYRFSDYTAQLEVRDNSTKFVLYVLAYIINHIYYRNVLLMMKMTRMQAICLDECLWYCQY
jgi:serine/threonine protein kinase